VDNGKEEKPIFGKNTKKYC